MSRVIMMPIEKIAEHPCRDDVLGKTSDEQLERIEASVRARDIMEPLIVTPPDAVDNPLSTVNGKDRLIVGRKLGLKFVPVIIDPDLRTEAAQIEAMYHYAQRKDFTPSQRATQAKALRKMLAALPPVERQRRGWQDKTDASIVSMVLRTPERQVHRLDTVFGESSTDALKRAVDEGTLPLHEAEAIINEAERRRQPGSRSARRLVDQLLERALQRKQKPKRRKFRRAPRTPVFNATPKKPSFLHELQRQLLDWAMSEIPPQARSSPVGAPLVNDAVKCFLVDVRTAASSLRVKLRRLDGAARFGGAKRFASENPIGVANEALSILGLQPVRSVDDVDLDEARRTHRVLARAYHPDLNDAPQAREKFERIHGAYERLLEVCDAR